MAEYLDLDLPIGYIDEATKQIKATPYLESLLFDYLNRTGGEAGNIINNSFEQSLEADKIPYMLGLTKKIDRRTASFNTEVKTSNYTAKNREYVEGQNGITIKFPANAKRSDEVIFANGDGSTITFDGNGNDIKYTTTDTTFITRRKGSSYHFHFFVDNVKGVSYWRPR